MIIYIVDRDLNVLINASSSLAGGYRLTDDSTVENVDTGVNTFQCTLHFEDETRARLEDAINVGRYVLKQSSSRGNVYDSLYQIVETELDVTGRTAHIYAEDAGLDLLNTLCPATTLTNMTMVQMLQYFLPSGWGINAVNVPTGTRTYTWDGEETCTNRIMSVVNLFGCELYYSFAIDILTVTAKYINVEQKRGNQEATAQLRLNIDVNNIHIKKTMANLYTALNVTGGTPEGANAPINLKGYNYSYTDPSTGDVYRVDTATGQMRNTTAMMRWASAIDPDGLMVGSYTFDTTDKAVLAGQARAQLQRVSAVPVNYEADILNLPDGVRIGDRINIIDERGNLYLEARILILETSVTNDSQKATLGEFVIRSAGIAEQIAQMASEFARAVTQEQAYSLEITSSAGDVFITTTVATTLTAHVYLFGTELSAEAVAQVGTVKWYNNDDLETVLGTGLTYTIPESAEINAISITARLET